MTTIVALDTLKVSHADTSDATQKYLLALGERLNQKLLEAEPEISKAMDDLLIYGTCLFDHDAGKHVPLTNYADIFAKENA